MKRILLSLLMLCTAVCAWSYTEETVTITCGGTNDSPFTVDAQQGSDGAEGTLYWEIRNGNTLKLKAKQSYYITKVEFTQTGDNVEMWDKLQKYNAKSWTRPIDDTEYYDVITFSNEYSFTKVTAVTVTYYHVCYGATPHEAVGGTCTSKGTAAYWVCVCGKIYSDAACTNEATMASLATETDPTNHINGLQECQRVEPTCCATGIAHHWHCADCGQDFSDAEGTTKMTDLTLSIDPTKHAAALTKHEAVAATCVSTGNVQYWQCAACNQRYKDEAGKTPIADVATEIDPTNHGGKLQEVAGKNASVVEEGVLHHWHCAACGNDYGNPDGTEGMTGKTVKARYEADALLVSSTTLDESYLFGSEATVTFDGDDLHLYTNGSDHAYTLSDKAYIGIDFAHTFKLKANQDPDNTSDYYTTFYTSEGAYRVPETAKAYAGKVEETADPDVDALIMTDVQGLIHKGEAVILRASTNSITLMPSCCKDAASQSSVLTGTDEAMTLGANDYALSLGQHGVGFYLWDGKKIGAN
ncbi:MAG: hypothetical protein KBS47_02505, partial [Bacteroidales bacterium]|nr:hypothetical protein [Candidatus Equimonas enterica]